MKGMLASRHRKQLSSSPIKEPIFLECQYNPKPSFKKKKAHNLFDVCIAKPLQQTLTFFWNR